MGHLGLQPQSVHAYGGFRVQGRSDESARATSRARQPRWKSSAFSRSCWSAFRPAWRARITTALRVPTIGIGAGAGCDGQVMVLQDLLGMNLDFHPKFARRFLDGAGSVADALARFDEAVKAGAFPVKRGELLLTEIWTTTAAWLERRRCSGWAQHRFRADHGSAPPGTRFARGAMPQRRMRSPSSASS